MVDEIEVVECACADAKQIQFPVERYLHEHTCHLSDNLGDDKCSEMHAFFDVLRMAFEKRRFKD